MYIYASKNDAVFFRQEKPINTIEEARITSFARSILYFAF